MGLAKFIVGLTVFLVSIFAVTAMPTALTGYSQNTIELAQLFIGFLGVAAVFIGILDRG